MARKRKVHPRPRDANAACHGFTGQVAQNGPGVMVVPRVFAIYWDDSFEPEAGVEESLGVLMFNQFINTILNCTYTDVLTNAYGVRRGLAVGFKVISSSAQPAPNPMSEGQLLAQLLTWFDNGMVPPPNNDDGDTLYLVLTPRNVLLTLNGVLNSDPNNGFAGYHLTNDNVNYAAIPWPPGFEMGANSPGDLVTIQTEPMCHEMIESFTDKGNDGWNVAGGAAQGCEIADICEPVGPISVFSWAACAFYYNALGACFPATPIENYLIYNAAQNTVDPHGFPLPILEEVETALSAGSLLTVAFSEANGASIVLGSDNYIIPTGLSGNELEVLEAFQSGATLSNVVAWPAGGWLLIGEGGLYEVAGHFPGHVMASIAAFVWVDGVRVKTLLSVGVATNGGYVIICSDNQWSASPNFPADVYSSIEAFIDNGSILQNVVFFQNGSALISGTNGDYLPVGFGFPEGALGALENLGGTQGPLVLGLNSIMTGSQLGALAVGLVY